MSSIKQIRSFIMVADLKSFTNAAEALFMTQPAISAQIKSLEETLGLPLLERNDKRVQLTEVGKYFYREAKEVLAAYDRAVEIMDDFRGLKRGKLALGASTIPGEYLLPRYIGEFRKLYPGIAVSLTVGDTRYILDLLLDRKIELGVVGAKLEINNAEFIPFVQDELVLIAAAGKEISGVIRVEDLFALDLIVREPGSGTRMALKKSLALHQVQEADLNIVMELGSTQAVITGVAADLGVGFVSGWAADTALKAGAIKRIKVKDMNLARNLYIVTLGGATATRAKEVFFQHLLGAPGSKLFSPTTPGP